MPRHRPEHRKQHARRSLDQLQPPRIEVDHLDIVPHRIQHKRRVIPLHIVRPLTRLAVGDTACCAVSLLVQSPVEGSGGSLEDLRKRLTPQPYTTSPALLPPQHQTRHASSIPSSLPCPSDRRYTHPSPIERRPPRTCSVARSRGRRCADGSRRRGWLALCRLCSLRVRGWFGRRRACASAFAGWWGGICG